MEVYVPDSKVMAESFAIIDETFTTEELEKHIMKLLRKYKEHVEITGNIGWHNIDKFVSKQMAAEKKAEGDSEL